MTSFLAQFAKTAGQLIFICFLGACAPVEEDGLPVYSDSMTSSQRGEPASPGVGDDENCAASIFEVAYGADEPGFSLAAFCEGGEVFVDTNGIPNYPVSSQNGTSLMPTARRYRIPTQPILTSEESRFEEEGVVGVATNGIPIAAPVDLLDGQYRSPETVSPLDSCGGQLGDNGYYHFHKRPDCLFGDVQGQHDLVVGLAIDGFQIMAPFACTDLTCSETRRLRSSWQLVDPSENNPFWRYEFSEGFGDLDRCNGLVGLDGVYRYYFTDEFPYVPTCFRGDVEFSSRGRSRLSVGQ